MAEQDYMSIVLRQLRKSKLGLAGLFVILFLAVIAIFAPFLAEGIPVKISHSNETDSACNVCKDLKESWDVLELKDGTVLEGTFVRELPIIVFKVEDEVVFELETVVVFESDEGETKRIPKSRIVDIDRESNPHTLIAKDEDGNETTYTGTFREEEPGETKRIPKSWVADSDRESKPHTLTEKDEDGNETTHKGTFRGEELGETKRFPTDQVDEVDKESTPNTLRLLEKRITFTGTLIGEEPGVIEFSVDGDRKTIPTKEKVKLYTLPEKHDSRTIWPLVRGLDRTDRFLLLGFGVFVAGLCLYIPIRKKGFHRGKAFRITAMILIAPLTLATVLTSLRDGERQLYNTVDFKELEQDQKVASTMAIIEKISDEIRIFRKDNNRYPKSFNDLPQELARKDAWGRDLVYKVGAPGDEPFRVISLGADGQPGGKMADADLSNIAGEGSELQPAYATIDMTWPLLSRFGPETQSSPNETITQQPPVIKVGDTILLNLMTSKSENEEEGKKEDDNKGEKDKKGKDKDKGKNDRERAQELAGPNWEMYAAQHPLGNDAVRRDVLSMMIHGTRISLAVGVVSVGIYVTIGIIIGAIAGFFGGWIDDIIMRIVEVVICFPTFFLIITIIAIAPPSIFWVMGAIAIVGWTTVARLVRAEFLKLRKNDFVTSAKALGASRARIIFRHILPNSLAPVLVSATFGIAGAILIESGLSFLGLGVPPQVATWGSVLRVGQQNLPSTWWLALIPGVAIFVTVTAYNLFGESLRDAIDPRLKGTQ